MVAFLSAIMGCQLLHNPEAVNTLAQAAGISAGYVMQNSNVDKEVIAQADEILSTIIKVVPTKEVGSVGDLWNPIIDAKITKLLESGKITDDKVPLLKKVSATLVKAVDKLIENNPKILDDAELVNGMLASFYSGFNLVLNSESSARSVLMDVKMYEYLIQDYK
jgi:hypothetical protein